MMSVRRLAGLGRNPLIGLVLVTGLTLAASGVNFIAQALLAYRFGAGAEVDGYAFSLSVPIFVAGLIGSIISYTVVPLIAVEAGNPQRQASMCAATALMVGSLSIVLIVLSLPGVFLQPLALPAGAAVRADPHLPAMILLAWFVAAAQVLGAVMIAQLNACQRPITAALLGLMPGIGTIASLILLSRLGIVVASGGLCLGSLAAAGSGLYLQRARLSWRPSHVDIKAEGTGLIRKALWAALALSCFSSFAISDAYWAVRMPAGSLAALGYVQRLIIGVGGLVVAGPSALFVPRFAIFVGNGGRAGFLRLLTRTLLAVWGLGAISVTVLYVYSSDIVALLFQRGAFGAGDVALLSMLLRTMAPGVIAMLSVVILMRALFCLPNTGIIAALLGGSWCVVYFSLSGVWHSEGAAGIARSYSVAWITLAAAMLIFTYYRAKLIVPELAVEDGEKNRGEYA